MILNFNKKIKGIEIYNLFFIVLIFYALPLVFLEIFIIDQLSNNCSDVTFWLLFLLGMAPCGIIGLVLSIIGLRKSLRKKSLLNKNIGILGLIFGVIYICGGILGLMLIYIVVGG